MAVIGTLLAGASTMLGGTAAAGTTGGGLFGSLGSLIAPAAAVAGTAVSYAGQQAAAKQSKQIANTQAKEQERQGQRELVAANRRAIEERRRAEQVVSRAKAAGAKTGTDGGDLYGIYGSIAGRGKRTALGAVRAGESAYESAKASAGVTRASGRAKASQMKTGAFADLIGGLGKAFG